jgi:nucleotide-binding universal stress UspA family protein
MNVLYATDGRESARNAGRLLTRLASPTRAEVTIFHVDEFNDRVVDDEMADATFAWALEHLDAASLPAQTKRVRSDVKSEIQREVDAGAYDLVVMGSGNTGWLGGPILGGVANYVLHSSSIPTLVVGRPPAEGRGRIRVVVGADASPASDGAIEALILLTERERCEIVVVSVVEQLPIDTFGLPAAATIAPGELDVAMNRGQEEAAVKVRAATERFERAGLPFSGYVVAMPGATAGLMDAIERHEADLVVVGSRGFGPLVGIALGSVSSHMVRAAPATLVAPGRATE